MSYALGIDLGTTYTAAAVWRNGRAEVASLGSRAAAIPSVVLLRQDETVLTGEAANRRALTEPQRVAREFKRRLGDTTPILLGGVPYSAEALTARLLRSVIDEVEKREGGPADAITVSHPANWGPYKTDLLRQAVRLANLDDRVVLTTEPEAAAVFYAHQQRIDPGAVVAVYDLGGGTFDAAVLRKVAGGFEILGQPEGIERLGGIDFDAAVFSHVCRALGGKVEELDENDPASVAAVGRLREECVDAKEALSADTDVSIPVLLPNISTEVRLTRSELEGMIRPALHDSIEALRRALRSAGVSADQLHSVLLVGGSSRMPLVAQLVGAELGRPVAVDAHPKHAVALGAAWLAGEQLGGTGAGAVPVSSAPEPATSSGAPVAAVVGGAAAAAAMAGAAAGPGGPGGAEAVPGTTPPPPPPEPFAVPPTEPVGVAVPTEPVPVPAPPAPPVGVAGQPGAPVPPSGGGAGSKSRLGLILGAAAVVLLGIGAAVAFSGDDGGGGASDTSTTVAGSTDTTLAAGETTVAADNTAVAADTTLATGTTGAAETTAATETTLPLDEQCTAEIMANPMWVCLTSARVEGENLVVEYDASFAGATPNVNGGFHVHIYGGDGTTPSAEVMGTHAPETVRGSWYVEDQEPSIRATSSPEFLSAIGDAPKVCARIAQSAHELVPDASGGYNTGNCVPLVRS